MEHKTIAIQTNTEKKGKIDQRSFSCQILELGKTRTYVLDETKNKERSDKEAFHPDSWMQSLR